MQTGAVIEQQRGSFRLAGKDLRVAGLLAALIVLNFIDLACTLFASRIGQLNEMNPLAAGFLRLGSPQGLVCYKVLMTLTSAMLLWRSRSSRWTLPACWMLVFAYGALGIWWWQWAENVNVAYELQLAIRP